MKPGPKDKKVAMLIAGEELDELKRFTDDMSEAFGLDRRIESYQGKKPMEFYRWDFDCLLAVTALALKDDNEYPDKSSAAYMALERLRDRLMEEYDKAYG
jgi:hypothetical protein